MAWHRSTEYPAGLPEASLKEKGRASVRYPSLRLPLDLTRSSVLAEAFVAGGAVFLAACPEAAGAVASSAIALIAATSSHGGPSP